MENATNPTNTTPQPNTQPQTIVVDPKPLALELRLRGYRYWVITDKLQEAGFTTTEYTIESWFRVGGALEQEYKKRMAIRVKELQEKLDAVENRFQEAAMDALAMLHNGLVKGSLDPDLAKAAQDILDRAGYPKKTSINLSGRIESDSMLAMANAIKGVLEPKPVIIPKAPIVEGQVVNPPKPNATK